MATEETKGNQDPSIPDGGGATGEPKTPETDAEFKEAYENQKKRAEIAEAKNKDLEAKIPKPQPKPEPKPAEDQTKIKPEQLTPFQQAQALRPYQDLDDTQAEQLEKVQKATSLSPAEAKKDPLFTAWNDKYVEAQKKEKAKLGASNGSSQGEPGEEPLVKPGQTRDEHKAVFDKMVGRK